MFFSKNKGPEIHDVVYLDGQACVAAVSKWLQEHPGGEVAMWFQYDLDTLRHALGSIAEGRCLLAPRLSFSHRQDSEVLFVGHYPLRSVETALYDEQGLKKVLIYSHLDMPVLASFGSGKIKELMLKMGMKPEESIEHPMITKAISNALDKIAENIVTDMPARSEAEWMLMVK